MARKPNDKPEFYPSLVISVHGIRTHGEWQKTFASAMSGKSSYVDAFDYGRYGSIRFLNRFSNKRKVDEFYEWYGRKVKEYQSVDRNRYDKRPSVVAHSFGTWIVGNAMLKYDDICFDKIILAGTILPCDFDWDLLFARGQVNCVRNECGEKDPWPSWASCLVARAGKAGSQGFEWVGSGVENIRCEWFGHGESLVREHIEQKWIPFLFREPSPLALQHGRNIQDREEFSERLDYTGTVIDKEVYGPLPHYDDVEIPRGLSLEWIRVNPDIYTFLLDRRDGTPAGYINAMPVEDDTYSKIRAGKIRDNQIPASAILPFAESEKTFKIYMMSIAIAERHRKWGEGIFQQAYIQLMAGFIDKLAYYWKELSMRATHILATAWSPEGKRLCQSLGMVEVGYDEFGDLIFELDVDSLCNKHNKRIFPPLRRLIKLYGSASNK